MQRFPPSSAWNPFSTRLTLVVVLVGVPLTNAAAESPRHVAKRAFRASTELYEAGQVHESEAGFAQAAALASAFPSRSKWPSMVTYQYATVLFQVGKFAEAQAAAEQALAIDISRGAEAWYVEDDAILAARAASEWGNVGDALEHMEMAIAIDVYDIQGDLISERGEYLMMAGRFSEALVNFEDAAEHFNDDQDGLLNNEIRRGRALVQLGRAGEALDITTTSILELSNFDNPNPEYWILILDLRAEVAAAMGHFEDTVILQKEGLALERELHGDTHPHVATAWHNLGQSYHSLGGHYPEVLDAVENAITIQEAITGPASAEVAEFLRSASVAASAADRHAAALHYARRSAGIYADIVPAGHPLRLRALSTQVHAAAYLQQCDEALAVLERIDREENPFNDDGPVVILSLTRLVGTAQYCDVPDASQRADALEGVADAQDYAPPHDRAMAYATTAKTAMAAGDTDTALRRSAKSLEQAERSGGVVPIASAHSAQAWALASAGRTQEAWDMVNEELIERREHLLQTRGQMSTIDWYSTIRRNNDLLALTAMTSPSPEAVLEFAMFLRDAGRWEAVAQEDSERESLRQAREDVATALLAPDVSQQTLQTAIARRDVEERAVRGAMRPFEPTTLAMLCDALPSNSRYVHIVPQGIAGVNAAYTALVVDPDDCTVTRHGLSDSKETDRVITQWRRAISAHAEPPQSVSASLYQLIWQPLEAAVGDAETVYIVPLRGMTHVPFATLSDGSTSLIERHAFVTLDAPSRLLADPSSQTEQLSGYVVGGLAFDGREGPGSRGSSCIPSSFSPLPGTATEAAEVSAALARHPQWQSVQPTPESVSKTSVLDALRSHQVVHLATHGFVADHHCDAPAEDPLARFHAPMATSGIVVSEANNNDGLLTAEELRDIDGMTADLVVLSACETGLGMQLDGVGVLGLRKALDDVDSVVLSLWRVPDDTTAQLMSDFYDALVDGASVQHAMRTAQLAARERGDPLWSWAAWVSHGTWTLSTPE